MRTLSFVAIPHVRQKFFDLGYSGRPGWWACLVVLAILLAAVLAGCGGASAVVEDTAATLAADPSEAPAGESATPTPAPTALPTAAATATSAATPTLEPMPTEAPTGPCPAGGEYLYFREDSEDKIMKVDLEGNLICEWSMGGSAESIAVAGETGVIYAFNRSMEQRRYNLTGAPLEPLRAPTCFDLSSDYSTPMQAKVAPDGNLILVLAASATSKQLVRCAPDGSLIEQGPRLDNIVDFAIDSAGDIWVIRVVVDAFSQSTLVHLSGDDWTEQAAYDIPGLRGITASPDGNLWVSQWVEDYVGEHKLLKLDLQGNVVAESGGEWGDTPGLFKAPTMLAADSEGNVYAYSGNWRLVKVDADGQYLAEWRMEPWLVGDMTLVQEPGPNASAASGSGASATTPSGTPAARADLSADQSADIMAAIPFPVHSQSLFPPLFFENGPQPEWATGEDLPVDQLEAEMGEWLQSYLGQNLPDDPEAQDAAIRQFIDLEVKTKVPDPRLRAALLAYTGTFAEPFIDYVLKGTHDDGQPILSHGILFDSFDNTVQGGALWQNFDSGEAYIKINENFRFEDPRVLGAILIFELAHFPEPAGLLPEGAPTNGTYEELMGAWLRGQYWAREIAKEPSLAGDPEATTNRVGQVLMNGEALLVVNANGILGSHGQPIIPGGALDWERYSDRFNLEDTRETVAPPVLGAVLANLAGEGAPPAPAETYTLALLEWADEHVDEATAEMAAAAKALNLDIPVR